MSELDHVKPDAAAPASLISRSGSPSPEQKGAIELVNVKTSSEASKDGTPKDKADIDEHLLSLNLVCTRFSTVINEEKAAESYGLTYARAKSNLERDGPNMMTPPKETPAWKIYFQCLVSLFNLLLLFSGTLCEILYGIDQSQTINLYLGIILIAVAFINALIEFAQLQKSASIMRSFLNMIPQQCWCLREGKLQQIPAVDLVQGDVVWFRMGDKAPADMRVFKAVDLKVDNSSLTGESEPQERTRDNDQHTPLEATNLVFNSSLIVNGEGYGIVIRCGDNTVLGQIAGLTAGEKKRPSPLAQEIDTFVKTISGIAITTALIFFFVGLFARNLSLSVTVGFAIGVFVSWVPEGLPATVTMLLTIAAKRMAQHNVLVKDLKGVETLGAITLLATDKTGTLTRNQMTVTNVWSNLQLFHCDPKAGGGANNVGEPYDSSKPNLNLVLNLAYLCSKAKFEAVDKPIAERTILADATEAGLFRWSASRIPESDLLHSKYPKVFEIPFNSENKWMLTVIKMPHSNGQLQLFIKGAPERVVKLCSYLYANDREDVKMSEDYRKKFMEAYEFMASKGHRVIATAYIPLNAKEYPEQFTFTKENVPKVDLVFLGLVSLEDPPKHGVREAVGYCRQAGVQVMMVTGDHPLTAEAIGRKINLMLQDTKEMVARKTKRQIGEIGEHEYNAVVVHGERIDSLTDEEWDIILSKEEIIFARTSPKHKLQIVKRCQARGHVVGVTGDGVNDSPALKTADLGIAMNISGSDVSKEAASMVLLDDNFASTVHGIEQGRLIFQNLKKSIRYTITHSIPEVMANLLFVVVPLPLPLSAILIIFVDLGFELMNGLSFAWELPESSGSLMKMLPRKPVTPASIIKLREKNALLQELNGILGKLESSNIIIRNLNKLRRWPRKLTSRAWWKLMFLKEDGETLVDGNVLSYAYLEMGVLETIGTLICFFFAMWYQYGLTPKDAQLNATHGFSSTSEPIQIMKFGDEPYTMETDEQVHALATGQSAYYFALMILQVFNMFICKTQYRLPFGKMLLQNRKTWIAVITAVVVGVFFVYPPIMFVPFGTNYVNPITWLVALGWGVLLLAYASLRILILRRFTTNSAGKDLPLQMQETLLTNA